MTFRRWLAVWAGAALVSTAAQAQFQQPQQPQQQPQQQYPQQPQQPQQPFPQQPQQPFPQQPQQPQQNDGEQLARGLCTVAVGTFITGQFQMNQTLTGQALQIAQQQTGGRGVYPQLQNYGQAINMAIANPHIDQDPQEGPLFHFYCSSQHQQGMLQWEVKFAQNQGKISYFAINPGTQPPQAPVDPNSRQPPEPRPTDNTGPVTPAPTNSDACNMFPGMC